MRVGLCKLDLAVIAGPDKWFFSFLFWVENLLKYLEYYRVCRTLLSNLIQSPVSWPINWTNWAEKRHIISVLTHDAEETQPPRTDPGTFFETDSLRWTRFSVRMATEDGLSDEVGVKHGVAHEARPRGQVCEEQPLEGVRAFPVRVVKLERPFEDLLRRN